MTLEAGNVIGTEDTPLTVKTAVLEATAGKQIWINAQASDLEVLLKALEVHLNAFTVNGSVETDVLDVTTDGDIRLNTSAINGLLDIQQMLTRTGNIYLISEDSVHMAEGQARGEIEITVRKGDRSLIR